MQKSLIVVLTGMAMGIADLVPGVSGGTIAFIAGVYERLLHSIHAIDKTLCTLIRSGAFRDAWNHINGSFLLSLVAGILLAIGLGALGLQTLLETYPQYVFSFFSGLIIASIFWFLCKYFSIDLIGWLLIGGGIGRFITTTTGAELPTSVVGFFIAGAVGSSAMILPGISGSYILLIVGMYEPVLGLITAFTAGDLSSLPFLISLMAGIMLGIITLGRILKKLYSLYTNQLILTMTGLMVGALPSIFPTSIVSGTLSEINWIALLLIGAGAGVFLFISSFAPKEPQESLLS